MSTRLRATIQNSFRLLTLSTFQKVTGVVTGTLYLWVLSPVAYAAWKSLATFFQIGIPGWTFFQAELVKRRAQKDLMWLGIWYFLMKIAILFGAVAISIVFFCVDQIIGLYPAATSYKELLLIGSGMFLIGPIKNCLILWWQVTGRYKEYASIQAFENALFVFLILIGFFTLHLGVTSIPLALVFANASSVLISIARRTARVKEEGECRASFSEVLHSMKTILAGEGKWVLVRESLWDWVEAIKTSILNHLLPAEVLGYILAGEALATYSTSFLGSASPVLNTVLPEMRAKQQQPELAYIRARSFLVTMSWIAYLAFLPVMYILTHTIFIKYAPAFVYYSFISLQMPWAAASTVLMPFLLTMPSQKKLLGYSLLRNVIEIGCIIVLPALGLLPNVSVVVAHLLSGYSFTGLRLRLAAQKTKETSPILGGLLPNKQGLKDVSTVTREVLSLFRRA